MCAPCTGTCVGTFALHRHMPVCRSFSNLSFALCLPQGHMLGLCLAQAFSLEPRMCVCLAQAHVCGCRSCQPCHKCVCVCPAHACASSLSSSKRPLCLCALHKRIWFSVPSATFLWLCAFHRHICWTQAVSIERRVSVCVCLAQAHVWGLCLAEA